MQMSICTRTPPIANPSAWASSANTALCRNVVPGLPPYSTGTPMPRSPAAPARGQKSFGGAPAFSHSAILRHDLVLQERAHVLAISLVLLAQNSAPHGQSGRFWMNDRTDVETSSGWVSAAACGAPMMVVAPTK